MDTEGVVISLPADLVSCGDFICADCSYGADDYCVWRPWTRRGLISPMDSFATAAMDTEGVVISLPVAPANGGDFVCGDCSYGADDYCVWRVPGAASQAIRSSSG